MKALWKTHKEKGRINCHWHFSRKVMSGQSSLLKSSGSVGCNLKSSILFEPTWWCSFCSLLEYDQDTKQNSEDENSKFIMGILWPILCISSYCQIVVRFVHQWLNELFIMMDEMFHFSLCEMQILIIRKVFNNIFSSQSYNIHWCTRFYRGKKWLYQKYCSYKKHWEIFSDKWCFTRIRNFCCGSRPFMWCSE